jgi:nicotinamidase/pyrazinamidase
MNDSDILRVLGELLHHVAPDVDPAALDPRARLREVTDLDSMDYLNFLIAIHERLGVDIPEADASQLHSLADLVGYLRSRLPHPLAPGDALIIIDLQRDFLQGGALAVPQGDAVIAVLNAWLDACVTAGVPVYATRDWHPADHCSFQARGGPWPPHCVAETSGAEFAPGLGLPPDAVIISKAMDATRDAYSAFDGTDLATRLQAAGARRLWIGGLATDYCVRATVLDALRLGFHVMVLTDAIRAVEVAPGDGARALDELRAAGATMLAGLPAGAPP